MIINLASNIKSILSLFRKELNRKRRINFLERENIFVHPDSYLGSHTEIGYGTCINDPIYIASSVSAPVFIGKYCALAHNIMIRPSNHHTGFVNLQNKIQNRIKFQSFTKVKGPVQIGNNVWLGDNVIILSGVSIGDRAVLGARSIVTKDIPAYSIAVGNPAKVIKTRFSDHITNQLIEIKWWEWSEEKMSRNQKFLIPTYQHIPIY